jgi:streptomycin 6-kinase
MIVERLCELWGLELVPGQPAYGDWNLVLLVRRGSEPCVLKVSEPDSSAADEAAALRTWNGHGAVRVLESAPEGLLLEQLDPGRSLAELDLWSAVEVAGGLVRTLSVPAPPGLRLLTDVARECAETVASRQHAAVPSAWLERARTLALELADDPGTDLVHGDLQCPCSVWR